MSRAPCAPGTLPSALRSLRFKMATSPEGNWRPQSRYLTANQQRNLWTSGSRIVFAGFSTHKSQVDLAPPRIPSRELGLRRGNHNSASLSDSSNSSTSNMDDSKPSNPASNPRWRSRDWDIIEAEAFEPLYSSSARPGRKGTIANAPDSGHESASEDLNMTIRNLESIDLGETEQCGTEAEEPEVPEEPEEALFATTHFVDEQLVKKAARQTQSSPASYWKYNLYADESGKRPVVHYCTTIESIKRVTNEFLDEPVLGFDLEWNPNGVTGQPWWEFVSVMQLASQSHIAIFHLSEAVKLKVAEERVRIRTFNPDSEEEPYVSPSDVFSPTLVKILTDPDVLKAGVNIMGDGTRVENSCSIRCRGLFELSHMYKLVKHSKAGTHELINRSAVNMAAQTKEILRLPLNKGEVRTGQWSQKLGTDQILYAASDAYVGLQLFIELDKRRRELTPRPPRPAPAEEQRPIQLAKGVSVRKARTSRVKATAKSPADSGEADAEAEHADGAEEYVRAECTPEHDALVKEATTFAETWFSGVNAPPEAVKAYQSPLTRRAHLRSYFLWHHKAMEVKDIGKMLDIKPITVANYIHSAVWTAKLPHDKARLEKIPKPVTFMKGRR